VLLCHPDGARIPFSLASSPAELPELTLHYRSTPGSEDARRVDALLANGAPIEIDLPHGHCGVPAPLTAPLLMLAGGTGISQARSILRTHAQGEAGPPLRLYWGVARETDLYLATELDALAQDCPRFVWTACIEEASTERQDDLRQGRLATVVAADVAAGRIDLGAWDLLLAGGPPMVWGTIEALRDLGLSRARTRADVFEYAPRDDLWPAAP
jgi:CDP-4-dehydro-6-deoxyglucose reductase